MQAVRPSIRLSIHSRGVLQRIPLVLCRPTGRTSYEQQSLANERTIDHGGSPTQLPLDSSQAAQCSGIQSEAVAPGAVSVGINILCYRTAVVQTPALLCSTQPVQSPETIVRSTGRDSSQFEGTLFDPLHLFSIHLQQARAKLENVKRLICSSVQSIDELPTVPPSARLPTAFSAASSSSSSVGRFTTARSSPRTQAPKAKELLTPKDKLRHPISKLPETEPTDKPSRSRWDQGKPNDTLKRKRPQGNGHPALEHSTTATPSPRCNSPLPSIPRRTSPHVRSTPRESTVSPGGPSATGSPNKTRTATLRWLAPHYCDTAFRIYRDVAHKLKKRADGMMQVPGGPKGKAFQTAQIMLTDSLLLYAYASWARDQQLRIDSASNTATTPSDRSTGTQEIRLPESFERCTSHRGVKDWGDLKPFIEHVTHQLRKILTPHTVVLEALLQVLHARITRLCATFSQGSVSRKINMITAQDDDTAPPPGGETLAQFATLLQSALKDLERSCLRENRARAALHPQALQVQFPQTCAALGAVSSDRKAASDQTLELDPCSITQITLATGFAVDRPPRAPSTISVTSNAGPVFPFPEGADAPAHLVILGRMLVAETVARQGLEYDLVSVPIPMALEP